ncbi:DNA-directed RNA polymerase, mitochondrial isoform X2 [Bombus pascuorum]|uniref:DNA-directed RNA polymerase, mitochondrial isoform X2 n=1 Tax=Bombus pascuorum TaxID=65598 RepID=UPI00298DE281|nr:DNA-directed RNA polymerase, mitochondrial isoform X2 [Bombus pascuorum]
MTFVMKFHNKAIKYQQVRIYGTTTVNILGHSPIKKEIKRKTKNYAELLTVTDKTASIERTDTEKLIAPDLSVLVDNPDITTDNSYESKDVICNQLFDSTCMNENYHDFCDTKAFLNIENNVGIVTKNEMKDNLNIGNKIKKNMPKKDSTFHSIKKTKLEKDQKPKNVLELSIDNAQNMKIYKTENKYGVENYVESLLAHIEVYLKCGLLNRANKTLMKYRKYVQRQHKCNKNNFKCNDNIELYNMLLEAYASRRKVEKVLELYDMIKNDSLTPTPQTYAYIFDTLGNETVNKKRIELLKKLNVEMNNYNISFDDIFSHTPYFKIDQQENILKAIRILMPNFEPAYTTLNRNYKCKLIRQIPMKSNYESPAKELFTIEELKDLFKTQLQTELAIETQIPSIESCKENRNTSLKTKIMELENYWKVAALAAFERNLKCLKQKECQVHNALMVLYPFLEVLDKEYYIDAILREIRQLAAGSETFSLSLKSLYITLGKYIYRKYEIEVKKQTGVLDKMTNIYSKYLQWYLYPEKMPHLNNMNNRTVWKYFEYEETKYGTPLNFTSLNWPMNVMTNIGKFLYQIILNDIMLKPEILKVQNLKYSIPAFYTLFRNKGNYLSEQIKPHPLVAKLYRNIHLETLTFESLLLPSCSPPNPWVSIYLGGYLIAKTDFIRLSKDSNDLPHKLKNTEPEQLFPIFDSLNQLSSIPWKINTAILDIIIKIFQDGGSAELNVPQSVSVLTPPSLLINKNATVEEKQKAAIAIAQYHQKKCDMYSLWCDTLYKLSIANHFRNKIFWLPHNLDFRGRTYPVPPYLNHLSSDLGRSLLLFGKGKPLGPNGLDWLKLHVINLTNFKKLNSVKERLEYANQNMDNILDSATKPLTGKMWWKQSEEPWQTLAACMEIANALKAPNVEEYVSVFPIHQDGSCNGLQHYAALGKDKIGAKSVNLHPFDTPKDVYSDIVSIIETQRQIDARNNVKIAQILEGYVKRKVIKQTVMTTVYGVTKYGAKAQIIKQLKEVENFPKEHIWSASIYLTESTFHSLRKMFKSAREIQDWFTECARIISSICYENVEWVTPLGLPIIQPYMKQQKSSKGYINDNKKPDSIKQRNAFAPNFIHSLDSTHMMLTGLNCNKNNITFVSVHDCFWTHPCTVDAMNKICREQFVALHSEPILEDLAIFFVKRYLPIYEQLKCKNKPDIEEIRKCLTNIPSKGDFNINNVLSSVYFFN